MNTNLSVGCHTGAMTGPTVAISVSWNDEFCGLPGDTICPGPKCLNSLSPQILQDKPGVVCIQTGENDIAM